VTSLDVDGGWGMDSLVADGGWDLVLRKETKIPLSSTSHRSADVLERTSFRSKVGCYMMCSLLRRCKRSTCGGGGLVDRCDFRCYFKHLFLMLCEDDAARVIGMHVHVYIFGDLPRNWRNC